MTATPAPGPAEALAGVLRRDRGRLLSALISDLRDFDLAEDALAEAMASALVHWKGGMPQSPRGWLLRVARRKALDRLRRDARWRDREADLALLAAADEAAAADPAPAIPDERLRLIFTCCHPALEPKSRVALTLRTLCGLTTAEIARAFLDAEPTMGQRLSRAKAKIAAAGIPYRVPGPEDFAERLSAVLAVIYLVFNEGYAATAGEAQVRADLCEEAIYLARMLADLRPGEPEVLGLLSLLLTTHARAGARRDAGGTLVPLGAQDRARWNRAMIAEGVQALDQALRARGTGPYRIKAAIGALLVAPDGQGRVDWAQVRDLYGALLALEPTPVVALNREVARAEAGDVPGALRALEALAPALDRYQPFHAARAELLSRSGDPGAPSAYDCAIALSGTEAERRFLAAQRDQSGQGGKKEAEQKLGPSPTGR